MKYLQDLTKMVLNCCNKNNYHGIIFTNDSFKNISSLEDVICLLSIGKYTNFTFTKINDNKDYLVNFLNDSCIFITSLEKSKTFKFYYNQAVIDPDINFLDYKKYIYPKFHQYID